LLNYAIDPKNVGLYAKPDITVERIGDLLKVDIQPLARC